MAQPVQPGLLRLRTGPFNKSFERADHYVECLLGPEPPKVISGYARYELINRPKRRTITEWQGTDPLQIEITFVVDYWTYIGDRPGVKCERDCKILEVMAGYSEKGTRKPPKIKWAANGPHDQLDEDGDSLLWVVTTLEWGDSLWASSGRRLRQAGRLVITEFVEGDFIRVGKGAKDNRDKKDKPQSGGHTRKTYKVKASDKDLRRIAQRELGSAALWTEIARLNGLRGWRRTKKWPRRLKMP